MNFITIFYVAFAICIIGFSFALSNTLEYRYVENFSFRESCLEDGNIWHVNSQACEIIKSDELTESDLAMVGILKDQLRILDGEFMCDYGIFVDGITCLVKKENIVFEEDGYRLSNGTRVGSMFENSDGEIRKLKQDKPYGYYHKENNFEFKNVGDKYYLIIQEPSFMESKG